ncbi:MAG TPA: 2-phospho-L-lactate guanylyltransferase [Polyangiaceae bacterium]|jgi:2-phospho-L-lactate guanylyltransferase
MTVAVVAVKDLRHAKTRLSPRFTADERRELVLAMAFDVLSNLAKVPALSGLLVVTPQEELVSLAHEFGAEVLRDSEGGGYTGAVELAVRELQRRGAKAMLAVPADVPNLTPDEISRVVESLEAPPSAVLVPSRNGRGTNAALLCPPDALPLRFGEPSFGAHFERATELGIRTRVLHLPGLALDLDTPEDVEQFLQSPSQTRTYELLRAARRP